MGGFFSSWIRIRNLNADSDPATQINADPDPKPCFIRWKIFVRFIDSAPENCWISEIIVLFSACSEPIWSTLSTFTWGTAHNKEQNAFPATWLAATWGPAHMRAGNHFQASGCNCHVRSGSHWGPETISEHVVNCRVSPSSYWGPETISGHVVNCHVRPSSHWEPEAISEHVVNFHVRPSSHWGPETISGHVVNCHVRPRRSSFRWRPETTFCARCYLLRGWALALQLPVEEIGTSMALSDN